MIPVETLEHAGRRFGTPLYVYLAEPIRDRFRTLAQAVASRFVISYAVKATASPTRFISHPEPREVQVETDGALHEVTESQLNAPVMP